MSEHKCDCWKRERQVCDICQGVSESQTAAPPPPKGEDLDVVQELPPLDEQAKLEIYEAKDSAFRTDDLYSELDKVRAVLHCRERQLSEALTEVKNLSSRCESLQASNERLKRVEEFVECTGRARAVLDRAVAAEAELARERELHRWRDVKQELPPKNEVVDVAHWSGGTGIFTRELRGWHVWIARYNDGWKRVDGVSVDPVFYGNVKFWRPRPEPPALLETKSESAPKPADTGEEK